ncbi:Lon protease [marine gamma proteobacterium HTCC2143]|uniref:Lon protease n=1 Tax=marine gamma proteobacterium HTCC2143 TaxID=247633 RepID=A0YBY2_9GAMM|nr:Lon protease [marine gamma proteobacterium HTCC2143]
MGDNVELIELPLLPLRDVVVYPHMVIPLFVGRERSIQALEEAMASDKQILLVAQKNASVDDPGEDDIYQVGTVSTVLQLLKLPDGTVKVLVEGGYRAKLEAVKSTDGFYTAMTVADEPADLDQKEADALVQSAMGQFDKYVNLSKKVPSEVLNSVSGIEEPGRLADTIAAHMSLELEQKQAILEVADIHERIDQLMGLMDAEIDLFQVEKRIRGRVKKQMEKSQREYYLNEQMKAIQKELGDMDEAPNEMEELQEKIKNSGMSKEAEAKSNAELNKLKMMSPMSAEASVVRSYLDWMVGVPWKNAPS